MSLSHGLVSPTECAAADFSAALYAFSGAGVTRYGRQFVQSVNGFTLSVGTGYGLTAGRWLKSDDTLRLTVGAPPNARDRTDALALRIDHGARAAEITLLTDVDESALRADPAPLHTSDADLSLLCFIRVRRGATYLEAADIRDTRADAALCGEIFPLADISAAVLAVYDYCTGGVTDDLARLTDAVNALITATDTALAALDTSLKSKSAAHAPGDLVTARRPPSASHWLLCDGSAVPAEYTALSVLLAGYLPDISNANDRYKTYIYAGNPKSLTVRQWNTM